MVLTCTHNLYFEYKIRKNILFFFSSKMIIFTAFKNICILHMYFCIILAGDISSATFFVFPGIEKNILVLAWFTTTATAEKIRCLCV